ncbi:MAG: PqqD family peptide modification chaperone [Rhizobiaceae bacterium]
MSAETTQRFFAFTPLRLPVRFVGGSEALLGLLPRLASGWASREVSQPDEAAPLLVALQDGAFSLSAPWLDQPVQEPDPFRAAANLAVDLLEAYLAENADLLAVHCGSAVLGGKAVLFPGASRAGKSTLIAALAAAGFPVLGDDVLALTPDDVPHTKSLGIHPRIRLPLPETASAELNKFVADHSRAADAKYAYLGLPGGAGPAFGRSAPLGSVVLLERREGQAASLASLPQGDGVQELMTQHLSPGLSQAQALPQLIAALQKTPCYRLRYDDLDEAVKLLKSVFVDGEEVEAEAGTRKEAVQAQSHHRLRDEDRTFTIGQRFIRAAGVEHHVLEGEAFLTQSASGAVYRLNPISSVLWRLVERPMSVDLCTALLADAFPDIDDRRILADVERLFIEMRQAGLVEDVERAGQPEALDS